jgi:hypothetical protein
MNNNEFDLAYQRLKAGIKTAGATWEKDWRALRRQVGNDSKQLARLSQLVIERHTHRRHLGEPVTQRRFR